MPPVSTRAAERDARRVDGERPAGAVGADAPAQVDGGRDRDAAGGGDRERAAVHAVVAVAVRVEAGLQLRVGPDEDVGGRDRRVARQAHGAVEVEQPVAVAAGERDRQVAVELDQVVGLGGGHGHQADCGQRDEQGQSQEWKSGGRGRVHGHTLVGVRAAEAITRLAFGPANCRNLILSREAGITPPGLPRVPRRRVDASAQSSTWPRWRAARCRRAGRRPRRRRGRGRRARA